MTAVYFVEKILVDGCQCTHLLTGLSATAADFSTATHEFISIGQTVTLIRAALANFGTYRTSSGVEIGRPQHEIGTGLTDFRAIQ
jgi:hypothetical protein